MKAKSTSTSHLVAPTRSPFPGSVLRLAIVLTAAGSLSGCVTSGNACGNEQRDWDNLHFPKPRYCSTPEWMPLRDLYEASNRAVCKVHDNNRGINGRITRVEADKRFLCDYIKHSSLPWGIRHVTGYLSYWFVSADGETGNAVPANANPDRNTKPDGTEADSVAPESRGRK